MLARIRSVVVVSDAPPAAPSFLSQEKRWGRKECVGTRLALSASEFRREPGLQASFHTIVTLRASYYAPPDTGDPNLQLVSVEYLPSIEGAGRICRSAPFRGKVLLICRHQMASPMMRINSRNRKKMTKGARREIVRCEQTDRTLLRDLPSQ